MFDMDKIKSSIHRLEHKRRFTNISYAELRILLFFTKMLLERKLTENVMYERYWKKIGEGAETSRHSLTFHLKRLCEKSVIRELLAERLTGLTIEQKCFLAQADMDEYRKESLQLQKQCSAILEDYRITLKALDLTVEDVSRYRKAFGKAMGEAGEKSFHSQESGAAKFRIFHTTYMNQIDATIQNLRMENSTLEKNFRKLRFYAKECENFELSFEDIDLEFMQVSCEQALHKLQKTEIRYKQTKAAAAKLCQQLTQCNHELRNELATSKKLKSDIAYAINMNKRLQFDVNAHDILVKQEMENLAHLKDMLTTYQVPKIDDYINKMLEISQLTRKNVMHIRKQTIARLALERHKRLWSRIKMRQNIE